eukprot:gnl/MRDRNA2_/MRDRNA2_109604_c0_seq1.p1 gnl/MRDRNA2_/MRDRNA2_109604_c0~~gnl/MRDRNA2_/MRDRNA2_109604_c0_seq1.p1  ORF type:complete len:855 (-),score=293.55 gnl/MRDRNA2_/MRDRNA2_109604_c0_seq1:59-2350(-)
MVDSAQQSVQDMIAEWEREQKNARRHEIKESSIVDVAAEDAQAAARNEAANVYDNEVASQSSDSEQMAATEAAKSGAENLLREALAQQQNLAAEDDKSMRIAKQVDAKLMRSGSVEQKNMNREDAKAIAAAESEAKKANRGASADNLDDEEIKAAEAARSQAKQVSDQASGSMAEDAKVTADAAQVAKAIAASIQQEAQLDGAKALAMNKAHTAVLTHEADEHLGTKYDLAEENKIARHNEALIEHQLAAAVSQQSTANSGADAAKQVHAGKVAEREVAKRVFNPERDDAQSVADSKAMELDEAAFKQQLSGDAKKASEMASASALKVVANPDDDEAAAIDAAKRQNAKVELAASFAGVEDVKLSEAAKKLEPRIVPSVQDDAKAKAHAEDRIPQLASAAAEDSKAMTAARMKASGALAEAASAQENMLADSIKVHMRNKEHAVEESRNEAQDDWSAKRNEKLYWERFRELMQPTQAPTPAPTAWMLDIGRGLPDEIDDMTSPDLKYGESASLVERDALQVGKDDESDVIAAMLQPMKRGLDALRRKSRPQQSNDKSLSTSALDLHEDLLGVPLHTQTLDEAKKELDSEKERLEKAREKALSKVEQDRMNFKIQQAKIPIMATKPHDKEFSEALTRIRDAAFKEVDKEFVEKSKHYVIPIDSLATASKMTSVNSHSIRQAAEKVKADALGPLAAAKAKARAALEKASQMVKSKQPAMPSGHALKESEEQWQKATNQAKQAADDVFNKALADTQQYIHKVQKRR